MTNKQKLIDQLKADYPTLKVGSDENETEIIGKEYNAVINEWAENSLIQLQLQSETETKQAAKLAIADRLGLTADELQVLLG
jgi:hypothetical protein